MSEAPLFLIEADVCYENAEIKLTHPTLTPQIPFEPSETILERLRPMPRLIDSLTLKACIDSLLRRITKVEACAATLASESTEQP